MNAIGALAERSIMMTSVEVVVGEEGAKLAVGAVVVLEEEEATAVAEETGMREELTMVEERLVMAGETKSGLAALAIAAMGGEVAAMAAEWEVAVVAVASMKLAGTLLSELAELAEGAIAKVVAEEAVEAAICAAW